MMSGRLLPGKPSIDLFLKYVCTGEGESCRLFAPFQHGVATPAGAERVVHFATYIFQYAH